VAHYHAGNFELAKVNYEKAVENNPENPDIYFNLGNVYQYQKDFAQAHQNFHEAIRRDD